MVHEAKQDVLKRLVPKIPFIIRLYSDKKEKKTKIRSTKTE